MELKEQNIQIGEGLDVVRFGMRQDEIVDLLGEADEVEVINEDEVEYDIEAWHYDELDMSITFEDDYLTDIAISSQDYTLAGNRIIGMSMEKVLKLIEEYGLGETFSEEIELEDGEESSLIVVPDSSLNLWFDDGVLSEIHWGELAEDEESA